MKYNIKVLRAQCSPTVLLLCVSLSLLLLLLLLQLLCVCSSQSVTVTMLLQGYSTEENHLSALHQALRRFVFLQTQNKPHTNTYDLTIFTNISSLYNHLHNSYTLMD